MKLNKYGRDRCAPSSSMGIIETTKARDAHETVQAHSDRT